MHENFLTFLGENMQTFLSFTGFANATWGHIIMLLVGLVFIFLAIKYEFEPMLLIPIGFGILIGNIPFKDAGLQIGIYEEGSVLNILYQGVKQGWYPPLIFLGIGAMTDFSALISNPKLILIGAAAQFGIFGAYIVALQFGFDPSQAGAIGIIGGADGPTAIFLSSKLAPNLMGAIAVSAYSSLHAPLHHEEGTCDPYEAAPRGVADGEDRLPHHRPLADGLPCTLGAAPARYALLRQPAEGKWCHPSLG